MATYLILNLVILAAVVFVAAWRRLRFTKRWGMTLLGLLVLTLIFDNCIIAAGIVTYDPAKILGFYLGRAPLEDFAYSIAASIIVPLLWRWGDDQ